MGFPSCFEQFKEFKSNKSFQERTCLFGAGSAGGVRGDGGVAEEVRGEGGAQPEGLPAHLAPEGAAGRRATAVPVSRQHI